MIMRLSVLFAVFYAGTFFTAAFSAWLSGDAMIAPARLAAPAAVASALSTAVLAWLARRSRLSRPRLFLNLLVAVYGIQVFMAFNDVAFIAHVLDLDARDIVAMGFAPFPVIVAATGTAAWLFGPERTSHAASSRPVMAWVWRLAVADALYVVLYISAGLLIAMQFPAVRAFYGDELDGLGGQILGLQFLRGLIWAGLAVLILSSVRGSGVMRALAVALAFAILFAGQIILPSDVLPLPVRVGHFVETLLSQFAYGFLAGLLLAPLIRLGDTPRAR